MELSKIRNHDVVEQAKKRHERLDLDYSPMYKDAREWYSGVAFNWTSVEWPKAQYSNIEHPSGMSHRISKLLGLHSHKRTETATDPTKQTMAIKAIDFYSHSMGPNPWKTVIVFEELNIPYSATYLDFGDGKGGVEHEEFLKKNPAGRVPLINDTNTGKSGVSLTESNVIDQYLVDKYDKNGIFSVKTEQEVYSVKQWLGFQAASQGPFFAQAMILQHMVKNMDAAKHFQGLVKRTIRTVDRELEGKQYLVGGKVTLADLAFIPWDNMLDMIMMNDPEAATSEQRRELFPNWSAWRDRLVERPAVQKMMGIQKEAQSM